MLATTSAASAAVLEVAVEEGRWRLLGGVVGLVVALAVILVVGGGDVGLVVGLGKRGGVVNSLEVSHRLSLPSDLVLSP